VRWVWKVALLVGCLLLGFAAAALAGGIPAPDPGPPVTVAHAKAPVPDAAPGATAATATTTAPQQTGPQPLHVTPPLGGGRFVFPIVGGAQWGDSYGVPRPDVPTGWHHGDDLFAPLGTPVVAVADGTLSSIGWEKLGGWRLWLTDAAGDAFYYAHLAGYTPLALNATHVRAGQVLGFVGNTGDADGGAYHLHFEVHPASLRGLGENGAVDPTGYLASWHLVKAVSFGRPLLPNGQIDSSYRTLLSAEPIRREVAYRAAVLRSKLAAARKRREEAARRRAVSDAQRVARAAAAKPSARIPVANLERFALPASPVPVLRVVARKPDAGSGSGSGSAFHLAGVAAAVGLAGAGLLFHRLGWLRRAARRLAR
jgi:Peptidase family M23